MVIRVPVLFLVVVPVVLELVVVFFDQFVVGHVGEGARTFPEQPVVVPLLELARFTKAARSSFSGHVVTCLGVVPPLCRVGPRQAALSAKRLMTVAVEVDQVADQRRRRGRTG